MIDPLSPPAIALSGNPTEELSAAQRAHLHTLRELEDIIAACGARDKRTFDYLPRTNFEIALELNQTELSSGLPLVFIAKSITAALDRICQNPRTEVRRQMEMLPLSKIRSQDARCLAKISRLPGRNILEKTSQTQKAPGVERYHSVNTAENRLVARVARELLGAVRAQREYTLTQETDELSKLEAVCQEILASPLGELSPNLRPEPNNALLSHSDYNMVWRVFALMRRHNEDFEMKWNRVSGELVGVIRIFMRAAFAHAANAVTNAAVVIPSWEQTLFSEVHDTEEHLFLTTESPFVVSVDSIESNRIRVSRRLLSEVVPTEDIVELAITEAPLFEGRGLPIEARMGRDTWKGYADLSGFRDLTDWILRDYPLQARVASVTKIPPVSQVGLDLSWPRLRLCSEDEIATGELLLGAVPESVTSNIKLLGDSVTNAYWDKWRVGTLEVDGLDKSGPDLTPHIVAHVLEGRVNYGGTIALLISDHDDEIALQTRRRSLPSHHRSLFIWRSAAMAMAWREHHSLEIGEGERVIVVDTEASSLSLLTLRHAEEVPAEGGCYWERPQPFGERGCDLASTADRVAEECAQRVTETIRDEIKKRLVNEGHIHAFLETQKPVVVILPIRQEGLVTTVHVDLNLEVLAKVEREIRERLKAWLNDFFNNQDFEVDRSPTHVLVGGLFAGVPGVHDLMTSLLSERLPKARLHILTPGAELLGAKVFLDRHDKKWATWRDLIPHLALEVKTSNKTRELVDLLSGELRRRGVSPGQIVQTESEKTFVIPKGEHVLHFPLVSDDPNNPTRYFVELSDECLPLPNPVEVRIHVRYRYAEDAFRIYLRPCESAPFHELELIWRKGNPSVDGGPTIINYPTKFPSLQSWEDVSEVHFEALNRTLKAYHGFSLKLGSGEKKTKAVIISKKKEQVFLKEQVENHIQWCKDLDDIFQQLIGVGRSGQLHAKHLKTLESCSRIVSALARIQNGPGQSIFKTSSDLADIQKFQGDLKGPIRKLEEVALKALGRLKTFAGSNTAPTIVNRLMLNECSNQDEDLLSTALGRVLQVTPDRGQEELKWLISELARRDLTPNKIRNRVWVLVTWIWSQEDALVSVSEADFSALACCCLDLTRRLSSQWLDQGNAIELFHELGLLALGLLRNRNLHEENGPFPHAKSAECKELSELFEHINNKLSKERGPRINIATGESDFGSMLTEALRGYREVLISLKEDT